FLVFLTYFLFLYGLPVYAIQECFPYTNSYRPYTAHSWEVLTSWLKAIFTNIFTTKVNIIFALLLISSVIITLLQIFSKKIELSRRNILLCTLLVLIGLYFLGLHEFLFSKVLYTTIWARPFSILLIFSFLGIAFYDYSRFTHILFAAMIVFLVGSQFHNQLQIVKQRRIEERFLSLPRAQILLGNEPAWIQTVEATSQFLKENLKKDELFWALPYDPLYYFLTEKKAGSRQFILFEHTHIPPQQEQDIIQELEEKNINYILMSNRIASPEAGLGVFGQTHCPNLASYIGEHFEEIASFGNWQVVPGWGWGHATKILKRKE
ncbi:MAG: hypothetical protein NUV91_07275, partial [Candidatus Omnitrophica bacterium]|nr:hypothetical protein [Candidatus Omnitrophota bacterium]